MTTLAKATMLHAWLFDSTLTGRLRRFLLLILLPSIVLVGTISFDFAFDDHLVILRDLLVTENFNLAAIFSNPVHVVDMTLGYYRPLVTLLYRVDWLLWGDNPAGYHLTNLLWHLIATLLLYIVAQRSTRNVRTAFASAVLFAVLPAHTEAVGWIQGRVDLVSTSFCLASLAALLAAKDRGSAQGLVYVAGAGLLFLAGLLAKESAVALPLAWMAWEVSTADQGQRWTAVLARIGSLVLSGLLYLSLRLHAGGVGLFPMSFSRLDMRSLGLFAVAADYARPLLLPNPELHFHRGISSPPSVWLIGSGALLLGALLICLFLAWHRNRILFPWVAWIPLTLIPPLFFLLYSRAPDVGFYTAERFLYLPSAGVCVVFGWLIMHPYARTTEGGTQHWRLLVLLPLAIGYACLSLLRLQPWGEPVRFYLAVQSQPEVPEAIRVFVHIDLGRIYLERNQFDLARREFEAALRLQPDLNYTHINMGVLLIREGRAEEAIPWLERAIQLNPRYADSYGNLGVAYEAVGNLPAAQRAFEAGLRISPQSVWLEQGLARIASRKLGR